MGFSRVCVCRGYGECNGTCDNKFKVVLCVVAVLLACDDDGKVRRESLNCRWIRTVVCVCMSRVNGRLLGVRIGYTPDLAVRMLTSQVLLVIFVQQVLEAVFSCYSCDWVWLCFVARTWLEIWLGQFQTVACG